MQRLEVSGAVWPLYGSLGVKGLIVNRQTRLLNVFGQIAMILEDKNKVK